jgi:hypothetical protein
MHHSFESKTDMQAIVIGGHNNSDIDFPLNVSIEYKDTSWKNFKTGYFMIDEYGNRLFHYNSKYIHAPFGNVRYNNIEYGLRTTSGTKMFQIN